jgi:hypothetical protein
MVAVPKRAEIKDLILNWYSKFPFKELAKLYPVLCISAAQVYLSSEESNGGARRRSTWQYHSFFFIRTG